MMKNMNQLINEYTCCLQHGEIQAAYKGIIEFMGKLRVNYIKNHPDSGIGSIYQGYMDMTYFSLITELLKDKGLKIAVVYLHEKGTFEVWLSARNRDIAKKYESLFNNSILDKKKFFHDDTNQDAIIEFTLTSTPNFEDQASLTDIIEQGVEDFITAIYSLL